MLRTLGRATATLALAGVATLGLAGTASATDCPTGTYGAGAACVVAGIVPLPVSQPAPGQAIPFTASGFAPDSTVVIQIHSVVQTLGTFTADHAGVVSGWLTIPSDFSGQHAIVFSGRDASGKTRVLVSDVMVATPAAAKPTAASSGGSLPLTGAEVAVAAMVGAGLVGAGGATLLAGRRRRVPA